MVKAFIITNSFVFCNTFFLLDVNKFKKIEAENEDKSEVAKETE